MNVASRDTVRPFPPSPPADRSSAAASLRYGRIHDGLGHQIHTILAMLYLVLLPLTTAPKDFAFGLLVAWALIRLPHVWRSYVGLRTQPMVIALVSWTGWVAVSMLWSPDAKQGFDELGAFRVLITPLLLWPILDRLPWLIAAALAGVFAHNVVQILQICDFLPMEPGEQDRIRGLIHPGKGGAWCAAAMLWHLFALMSGRGWLRWLSLGLLVLAGAGLIASGSRGAWVSAAVAVPSAIAISWCRRPDSRSIIGVLLLIGGMLGTAVWIVAGPRLGLRVDDAVSEVRDARERGVYWTSSGLRIALWSWAWEVFQQRPVAGVGAGGFSVAYPSLGSFQQACDNTRQITQQELAEDRPLPKRTDQARIDKLAERRIDYMRRGHAHSTYLHTLAQQGLIGAALLACSLIAILWRGWKDRPDHVYAGAATFVLISWMVGAQFDCYELNGNQLGLLALVVASVMPHRAAVRLRWKTSDSREVAA